MSISAATPSPRAYWTASRWTAEHIAQISGGLLPEAPMITAADVRSLVAGQDLWDIWPLQNPDGSIAQIGRGQLWMILSAPIMDDPAKRHDVARTRLLYRGDDGTWTDC
ncbi:MAG TPA: hypothetical protein VGN36_07040, partial [Sphingorhabdus sp.]|nr:hypothetical protein [Sphingorhabdus sp.]